MWRNPMPLRHSSNIPKSSLLVRLLLFLCILTLPGSAEEQYVWKSAVVMTSTPFTPFPLTHFPLTGSDPQDLISGRFKSLIMTDSVVIDSDDGTDSGSGNGDVWISIDGQQSLKYSTIYVNNRNLMTGLDIDEEIQRQIGRFYICIGDDPAGPEQPGNQCTAEAFYDGGFLDVSELPAGRYIYVFRKGFSSSID